MEKKYLLAMICLAMVSCSGDDLIKENTVSANEKQETFNFSSYETMDKKIDEISFMKERMEMYTAQKYAAQINNSNESKKSETLVVNDLKNYHRDRLKDIYDLRKKINFVSIQSIADEINSLTLLNPSEAKRLLTIHEAFLFQDNYEIKTVFENRTANVINENGKILIDGVAVDLKNSKSNNPTGRYVGDESIRTGIAAVSVDQYFKVEFSAGREKHKDTFGKTFFRYYTEFKAYYINPNNGIVSLCPAYFTVYPESIAGFSQTGSFPFSDFAFTMQYPSGYGSSIRNIGGQKWIAYQTEGGTIKGYFSTTMGEMRRTADCNFKYTR